MDYNLINFYFTFLNKFTFGNSQLKEDLIDESKNEVQETFKGSPRRNGVRLYRRIIGTFSYLGSKILVLINSEF